MQPDMRVNKFMSRRFMLTAGALITESAAMLMTITPENSAGVLAAYGVAVVATIGSYGWTRSDKAGGREETP